MVFFEYGGIKNSQRTKLHIANENGEPLCGIKSFWMQCYDEILENGEVHANYGIGNIKDFDVTCKKCLKKWLLLIHNK